MAKHVNIESSPCFLKVGQSGNSLPRGFPEGEALFHSLQINVHPFISIVLGNTCSGPDEVGEEALKSGFLLKAMTSLLNSSIHHLRKESLWLLCNLTAGSIDSVKAVLETGLLPVVVEMLDGPFDVRKEVTVYF